MKNIRSSYKIHKAKGYTTLNINEYAKIANAYNKFIMDLIFNGQTLKMPSRLGTVSIKGKYKPLTLNEEGKIMSRNVDYKATKELWAKCPECQDSKQLVYHDNEHTNGVKYQFFWSKERMIIENKIFYEMVFTRTNKRKMAELIFSGTEFYVEPTKEVV